MADKNLTPEQVFNYAISYFKKHDRCPTLAQTARRFKCKISDAQDAIQNYQGPDYLGVAVGGQTESGYFLYDREGEYQVEAY